MEDKEKIANHHRAFLRIANKVGFWVLVRRMNPASYRYVDPGPGERPLRLDGTGTEKCFPYVPKRLDCKAKTADRSLKAYEWAGLVVDPTLPEMREFTPFATASKAESALKEWAKFKPLLDAKRPYTVDTDKASRHYGCVRMVDDEHGDFHYIHGDYDLWDVIDPLKPTKHEIVHLQTHGQDNFLTPEVHEVMMWARVELGIGMINHGAEASRTTFADEPVDAFGPDGEQCVIPNESSLRELYRFAFANRQVAQHDVVKRCCYSCHRLMQLSRNPKGKAFWKPTCKCLGGSRRW